MKLYIKKFIYLIVLIGFSCANAGSYEDFFRAVELDDAHTVQQLLVRGFDPNSVAPDGQAALLLALKHTGTMVAEQLISHSQTKVEVRNRQDESPLMLAALKGHLKVAQSLIARDADVNKTGWAPLHYAATGGHVAMIQLLLDNHAYIDAESPNGSTPLMMAAMYGNAESVKALLDAGADPQLKNMQGLSALSFAERASRADALALISAAIRARAPKASW